jgi:hypothetical protein
MTDRERRMRLYVDTLVIERENLRKNIRRLEQETIALHAQLARQAVKDSLRGMENM